MSNNELKTRSQISYAAAINIAIVIRICILH